MEKIRVLCIAPYNAMISSIQQAAEEFNEIQLDVFAGDLLTGVSMALANFHNDYDLIISRGGTATLLHKTLPLPVIEIPVSAYDILSAYKLASTLPGPIAAAGFWDIESDIKAINQLLGLNIVFFKIQDESKVDVMIKHIKNQGYNTVLCDMSASVAADKTGLNAILIESGYESIKKAFINAIGVYQNASDLKAENRLLRQIIGNHSGETIVFDEDGHLYYSSLKLENRIELMDFLHSETKNCTPDHPSRIIKSLKGVLYTIKGTQFTSESTVYSAFYLTHSRDPETPDKRAIRYFTLSEATKHYEGAFNVTNLMDQESTELTDYSLSRSPLMILGEHGTGKEIAAFMSYQRGRFTNHPYVIINCALISEKIWDYLVNNHNSPFVRSEITIFIHCPDVLSLILQNQLVVLLSSTDICLRNKVIFSCTSDANGKIPDLMGDLVDRLGCAVLSLPSLRSQSHHLSAIVNLCINRLNMQLGTNVLGIEPKGLYQLQLYFWPHNHAQLERVLQNLITITKAGYISEKDVTNILQSEKTSPVTGFRSENPEPFNLNRTMQEMEAEIVNRVIKECGGNQSAAARRLGISRTSIWRYMRNV